MHHADYRSSHPGDAFHTLGGGFVHLRIGRRAIRGRLTSRNEPRLKSTATTTLSMLLMKIDCTYVKIHLSSSLLGPMAVEAD